MGYTPKLKVRVGDWHENMLIPSNPQYQITQSPIPEIIFNI